MDDTPVEAIKIKGDPLINFLHRIITYCVRFLAILMVIVIVASIIDVMYVMYDKIIITKPVGVLHIEEILTILGAFIGVLIAIEIFNNIIVYLREDAVHVKLVLATALIAVSRKVIILDYKTIDPIYIFAIATVVLATAIGYWIITNRTLSEKNK